MKAFSNTIGKLLGQEVSSSTNTEEISLDDGKANDKPYVISSFLYLAVIGFIGLPMWYHTCSITRHPLPDLSALESKLRSEGIVPPQAHLDVSVIDLNRFDATKSIDDKIPFIDPRAEALRKKLNQYHLSFDAKTSYNISWRIRRPLVREHETFTTHLSMGDQMSLMNLESDLTKIHKSVNKFRLFMYMVQEENYDRFCRSNPTKAEGGYILGSERFVFICAPTEDNQDYDALVNMIQTILHSMYVGSIDKGSTRHIRHGELDLLLSLLPEPTNQRSLEDLSHLAALIHNIYQKNLERNFLDLKELVNVRLIVQNIVDLLDIDSFSGIANSSKRSNDSHVGLVGVNTFDKLLHSYESRVSKHSTQQVYNAILIDLRFSDVKLEFDSECRTNLLRTKDSSSVLIVNDEKSLVLGLRSLIRSIVGLKGSLSKNMIRGDLFFSKWEIDALLGYLTLRKLDETLDSLISISQQVLGVKIPREVSVMAAEANSLALKSIDRLRTKHSLDAFRMASRALKLSDLAYYDPSLLESLYFPDELKYAIYLPLFLPLALPLIMSLYRLVKFSYDFREKAHEKVKIN